MKKYLLLIGVIGCASNFYAQPFSPQAGEEGSTAIHKDSSLFVAWANEVEITRGYKNIANPALGYASGGEPAYAVGYPDGDVVSLGDRGEAVLFFNPPIANKPGFDFAVFENGSVGYLELAVVEISSDGVNFFRFPAMSMTSVDTQLGTFATPEATQLHNIAGKYINNYGTPFDISDIYNSPLLDKSQIRYVKVIDVVGSIDENYGTPDSNGQMINDSYPTPFDTGGFDLQAVGVIHQGIPTSIPESEWQQINIYPNPFDDYIVVDLPFADEVEVFVYDLQGVLCLYSFDKQIDSSGLTKGVYLLRIKIGNQQMVKKIHK